MRKRIRARLRRCVFGCALRTTSSNPYWLIVMFIMAPLACILIVESNIIVSLKSQRYKSGSTTRSIVVLPLLFVVIFSSTNTAFPNTILALMVSSGLAVADVALFYVSKATFLREEILTNWK
jgi:ABC-2 type transport system permease protein